MFPGGGTEKLYNSKIESEGAGTPLPISPRWLECADDELSALAVKFLSLSHDFGW